MDTPHLAHDSEDTLSDSEYADEIPASEPSRHNHSVQQMRDTQLEEQDDTLGDIGNFFEDVGLEETIKDRDAWMLKAEEGERRIANLQKRLNNKLRSDPELSSDLVDRLKFLEKENQRLKSENNGLKSQIKATTEENALLSHETNDKANKLKGANKRVRNEKNVVKKAKEEAEYAKHMKNERLKAERKGRKERNDALAALEEQRKINEELRAELEVEKSGRSHMREDGTNMDDITVVIPIEFKIYRGDFKELKLVLEANRMKITEQYRMWYMAWKKPKAVKVVGAGCTPVNDTRKKIKVGMDLYDDMTDLQENLDRDVYIPVTGLENNGWRSKRELQEFCKDIKDKLNNIYA